MRKLAKYLKPYWVQCTLGPFCKLMEAVLELILPTIMAYMINDGVVHRDLQTVLWLSVLMLIMVFAGFGFSMVCQYNAALASQGFGTDMRNRMFRHIQRFSYQDIDHFTTTSLINRIGNDVNQLQVAVAMLIRLVIRAPFIIIGAIIMAVAMNPGLARIFLVILPVMVVTIAVIMMTAFPRFTVMQKKLDRVNSNIQECLQNVRVIKSFVRGDYEEKRFFKSNGDLKESSLRAFKIVILQMPLVAFFMNVTTLAVVWLGGQEVLAGDMQVGNLTAFTTYIVQVLMSLMMLAMVFLQSSRAIASAKRINEILDTEIDLTDENASQKEKEVEQGRIEFRHVSFRYYKDSREKVLDDISLAIEPGQTVGIIGSTGCGKTTLVSMIPRLYDVDEGQVLVDGVDVREYSLNHLREGVGMVLQKNVLFSGTVEENLRWGDENASTEQVREAAQAAQADVFLSTFPEGYETFLGQGGVNVSGGQKQRLCIARALLKKPRILILDDSTSAVDTATEAKIRESFSTTLKGTTKLIIAQRITSVMEADLIVVMDEGKIVGQGSHEELLKSCEAYREICYSQMDREVSAS